MADDVLDSLAGVGGTPSGTVGSVVYSHNTHGAYSYTKPARINPDTVAQRNVRNSFGLASQDWLYEGPARRQAWDTYARNVPHVSRVGRPCRLSGFNRYVGVATLRGMAGSFPPFNPPEIFTLGLLHAPLVERFLNLFVRFTFDTADRWLYQNNARVWCYQSQPVTRFVNHFTGPFHMLGGRTGSPSSPPNPITFVLRFYPTSTRPRIYFRTRIIEEDNRLSPDNIQWAERI